jgi:hypothetical protein
MSPGVLKHIYEPGSAAYRTKADNRTGPRPTELLCVATNHNCPERQRKLGAAVPRIRNSLVPLLQQDQVSIARGRGPKREVFETRMTRHLKHSHRRGQNDKLPCMDHRWGDHRLAGQYGHADECAIGHTAQYHCGHRWRVRGRYRVDPSVGYRHDQPEQLQPPGPAGVVGGRHHPAGGRQSLPPGKGALTVFHSVQQTPWSGRHN